RFNQWLRPPVWSDDGNHLLFIAPASGTGQGSHAVWTVPRAGGEAQQLALGETSCAGELKKGAHGQGVVVSIAEGLGWRLAWLNPQTGALDKVYSTVDADTLCDLGGWSATRLADGTMVLAAAVATSVRPGEVWAGRAAPGEALRLTRITNHQTAFDEVRWGVQEPFTWRALDGWELDGVLIRPPDAPSGPLPLVALVHGGPYGRYGLGLHLSWGNWGQWLATAGYAVLMPNYRGGMGHGDRFASAARGGVGEGDFSDILSAIDAAIERGIADPDRLAIGGWSQGGFMTAWAVTQTGRFKAGIMGAGVSDWGMMVMTSDVPDFERELGGAAPWDGLANQRHLQLSPITFARRATTPLLILHGKNDARVPVSQAIGFHRALREAGCPSELVVYPREPHGIGERAHQLDVLHRVRTWVDRWLKDA
ncbi:MAG: S9 family peptidase, partial [Anaerolineae bacterium]|nr:S9 family peptidase [Anaerolineae bacterium]